MHGIRSRSLITLGMANPLDGRLILAENGLFATNISYLTVPLILYKAYKAVRRTKAAKQIQSIEE